jgi:hypothetical protein
MKIPGTFLLSRFPAGRRNKPLRIVKNASDDISLRHQPPRSLVEHIVVVPELPNGHAFAPAQLSVFLYPTCSESQFHMTAEACMELATSTYAATPGVIY